MALTPEDEQLQQEAAAAVASVKEAIEKGDFERLASAENEINAIAKALLPDDYLTNPLRAIQAGIIAIVGSLVGVVRGVMASAEPTVRDWTYEANLRKPNLIPSDSDVLTLALRGFIDQETATTLMTMHGYAPDATKLMLRAARSLTPVGELLELTRRGEYTDQELLTKLTEHGFTDPEAVKIATLKTHVPPVSDTIRFLVRDVFEPDIVANLYQPYPPPPRYLTEATRVGLNPTDATNYWYAHWEFPPMRTAFNMLHREAIDSETIDFLLKIHDVHPSFWDAYKKIAHTLLTRVDIMRMHATRVLTDEEVKQQFLHRGYSEENAQRLTDFTLRLSAQSELALPEDFAGITRATITRMLRDGLIDETLAIDYYELLGIGREAAQSFIDVEYVRQDLDELDADVDLIIQRYKSRQIDIEQAKKQIQDLGIDDIRSTRIETELLRIEDSLTETPPKADLNAMLKNGIIDEATYRDGLATHGYNDFWQDKYIQLIVGGTPNA